MKPQAINRQPIAQTYPNDDESLIQTTFARTIYGDHQICLRRHFGAVISSVQFWLAGWLATNDTNTHAHAQNAAYAIVTFDWS